MPVKSNLVILDDKLIARNLLHFVYKKKKSYLMKTEKNEKKGKMVECCLKQSKSSSIFPLA